MITESESLHNQDHQLIWPWLQDSHPSSRESCEESAEGIARSYSGTSVSLS